MTLWLDDATQLASAEHKARARVVLHADIDDFELWDSVVLKLNGLRIYTIDDFKGEMLTVLQQETHRLESDLEQEREQARAQLERVTQGLDLERARNYTLELELRKAIATVSVQQDELKELRELKAQLDGLTG